MSFDPERTRINPDRYYYLLAYDLVAQAYAIRKNINPDIDPPLTFFSGSLDNEPVIIALDAVQNTLTDEEGVYLSFLTKTKDIDMTEKEYLITPNAILEVCIQQLNESIKADPQSVQAIRQLLASLHRDNFWEEG